MIKWLKRLFALPTAEGEYARGLAEGWEYRLSHSPEDCAKALSDALCDRDLSEGIAKFFAIGWIAAMRETKRD